MPSLFTSAVQTLLNKGVGFATQLGAKLAALETRVEACEAGELAAGSVGTTELAADAVTEAKIADDAVSLEHLDAGITPGKILVAEGLFTTAGGDANESITATGCLGTDTARVWVQKDGATPRTVDTITPGTDAIAVVMSGDPSTDHKLLWQVWRAPA